uniref:Phosphatidylinositol-glycan biosynthesis class W protein n=1 Tax=Scylla olivacea TaxID=85551 RepID=A0A0N7ZA53_SCYOL
MGSVRAAHEAFVTGHSGTTPQDVVLAVSSAFPGTLLVAAIVQGRLGWQWFLLECVLLVTPVALGFTVMADFTPHMLLCSSLLASLLLSVARSRVSAWNGCDKAGESAIESTGKRVGCVTCYRALLNLATTIAILAVDFHCFPRRFAKTEVQGYSVMDVGAAGYVIANALVEGRRQASLRVVLKDTALLVCLGLVRLAMVWAADYQHHVTEYGVHGNFFFTLAALKLTCSWWAWRLGTAGNLALMLALCLVHHLLLTVGGVEGWTLGPVPRDSFLNANREWFVSMPSYAALYFTGAGIGAYVRDRSKRATVPHFLWAVVVASAVSLALLHFYVDPASRRLGNAAFVAFSILYASLTLAIFSLLDIWIPKLLPGVSSTPRILQAINQRPLLNFLLSNLATGVINKSVNTLTVLPPWDFTVVLGYTICVTAVVYFLFKGDCEGKMKCS